MNTISNKLHNRTVKQKRLFANTEWQNAVGALVAWLTNKQHGKAGILSTMNRIFSIFHLLTTFSILQMATFTSFLFSPFFPWSLLLLNIRKLENSPLIWSFPLVSLCFDIFCRYFLQILNYSFSFFVITLFQVFSEGA